MPNGIYKAPYEYEKNRVARIAKVKTILLSKNPIEEKDKQLAQLLKRITMRRLREYVKVLLVSEEITKQDFEGSKLIKLRGV